MYTSMKMDQFTWGLRAARPAAGLLRVVVGALATITALAPFSARGDFLFNGDIRYAMNGNVEFIDPANTNLPESRNDGDTEFDTGATVGGDLLIGDVGTGGMVGSNALPLITFDLSTGEATNLKPIRSDNAVIGNQIGSEGTSALSGFMFLPENDPSTGNSVDGHTEPFGGNWRVRNDLAVGNNGNGTLSIDNRARVEVGGVTTVGGSITSPTAFATSVTNTGSGNVNINGVNSRLVTTSVAGNTIALVVGVDTQGIVDVSGGGALETRNSAGFPTGDGTTSYPGPPTAQARTVIVGMLNGGDGLVRLRDSGTFWDIDGDLFLGNGQGGTTNAQGSVEIIDDALLQVGGSITTNTSGNLVMRGGTARLFTGIGSSTLGTIANNGAIIGDGLIDAGINIGGTGVVRNQSVEIDNAGTVTTLRELLTVTGQVIVGGGGLIESTGGEMIFQQNVASAGVVFARDATIQFEGGLTGGNIVLLGDTTIIGNLGGVTINTNSTNPGVVQVVGNVTYDPSPIAAASSGGFAAGMAAGPEISLGLDGSSPLDIDGDLILNGIPTLDFQYLGEDTIDLGSVITAISVSGDITGTFANDTLVAEGFNWDIDIVNDNVLLTADSIFSATQGDFDSDGDIDGIDFLTWQTSVNDPVELDAWETNYGGSTGGANVATTAVPEPSTIVLALATILCCPRRRSRS